LKYSELTMRHFRTADRAGVLGGPDTRRGAAGDRAQGTWVQFDLRFAPQKTTQGAADTRLLQEARFLAYGCPHVIAVADWLAQQAPGRGETGLPEGIPALQRRFDVPTEKRGRLLIVEDAWIAAATSPYPT
jgi:hypothetical protein